MPAKHQKIKVKIPTDLTASERKVLADLVIEKIYERTVKKNVDKDGKPFPKYSKGYTDSLDFKNAGKSKSKVDLQLSGDMLAAMDLLSHDEGFIEIGFKDGTEENARADGNIRGTYGQQTGSRAKARNFLGISKDELKPLVEYVERRKSAR